jgi:methylmalonyl-CoA/ethylmalonyl-CoA epimerase
MLGRVNHVAIAAPHLAAGPAIYRDTVGARVSQP